MESGQPIPNSSSINNVKFDGEGFVSYVECSLIGETKYVRKNITLPEWMNVKAEKMGLNFSNVLQEAILAKLGMS